MDLGDLELRGILARKSQLFLRLDRSHPWIGLRRAQINPRAQRKYRTSNIGSPYLVNCFFWNYCDRDILRARIRARASLASDHCHLDDRIRSNYFHAPRLLACRRKNAAARGIVSDLV